MQNVNRKKYALASVLGAVIFVIIYKYTLSDLTRDGITDLIEHTRHAESIYLDRLAAAWLKRPYLFWHLCVKGFIKFLRFPVNEASACTCGIFAAAQYFLTFFTLDRLGSRYSGRDAGTAAACISGMLSLVMPLYVWWFNAYQYEGQFSINPFFNPTHMAVKPIGMLTFLAAVDLIRSDKGEERLFFTGKRWKRGLFVLFGAALLLSTFTKPTFMYMLLPAGAVYLLIDLGAALIRRDGSWKRVWNFMWKIACASIPSLVYLLAEYSAFYLWGGTNDDATVAIYPIFTAWHEYSPDVPTSVILAMAFPLWMLVTNGKYFLKSVEGRLSVISYGVGALEFSFFVETGAKLGHLNFSWPMMSGMLLFWVIAGARLTELTMSEKSGWKNTVTVTVGWFLLTIYLFSGLYYLSPNSYII